MTVTFGAVELKNPEVASLNPIVICNTALLLSGKTAVQASSQTGFAVTMQCVTTSYSDVSGLIALIGQAKTLTIEGNAHTNCYIKSFPLLQEDPVGTWWYTVSFVQDTT